ncbi:ferritin-like domain-containing protein [Paracoccus sp. Z118]|uniref:YciE/YciF ferroxidase family protein n=1 Tax=Paracoccus sp. Z118 TaxID=2851017 RepID=UPI001C2B9BD4|nr:ferritin-like domain-containing protein [Paracoccus sp. Z118]MBV0890663.1 ferritin-like domain-containing protein [Paracoccus sp. Z118]
MATTTDKTLEDLLEHGLKDMYYAEKAILKALPKMAKAAQDDDLRDAIEKHRKETEGQIENLEKCFEAMDKKPTGEKCDAMDGILKEGDSLLKEFGGTPAGDAAIIFAAQAVEHYEITRYGSLRTYAEMLGMDDVADLLNEILEEEAAADETLSDLAEDGINDAAMGDDDEGEGEGEE